MGFVEQSVQEVVRWKCGMREKTIQPRCARGTAPLSAAFAASFPDGQVKTFRTDPYRYYHYHLNTFTVNENRKILIRYYPLAS